jgi:hypothetical protein
MSTLRRSLLRAGTALLGAASLVAVATPARAAVSLFCDSSAAHIACSVNGAPAGSTIHWTLDGNAAPAWDNITTIRFGCTPSVFTQIGVQVIAPGGATSTSSRGVRCTNNKPT